MCLPLKQLLRLCLLLIPLLLTQCGGEATPEPVAKEPVNKLTLVSFAIGYAGAQRKNTPSNNFARANPISPLTTSNLIRRPKVI